MNTVHRYAIVLATAASGFAGFAGQALAQEATYELPQPVAATQSRADVRAELLQARRAGTLLASEADFQRQPTFVAAKTRASVAADVRLDAGASQALTAEPHGFDVPQLALRLPSARLVASATR